MTNRSTGWATRRSALGSAVGGVVLLLPGLSAAQGTPSPPAPPVVTVTVDVREVLPEDTTEAPGAATLTAVDLLTLRPFSLHDALAFLPGVAAVDDDVLGRRSGIGVRGAPVRRSRKTLLLEDGTPINASTYLDPSTHYTPPIDRLERVDVLKGGGHVIHGPLNNYGIINFRNKQASAVPETVFDAGIGSRGVARRHLLHRRTLGVVGVVGSYTGAHADGAFDVERHQFDDVFGSVTVRPGSRHEVQVASTYFRERSSYDESNLTPQEFAVAPRTKRDGQQFNTLGVNLLKVDATYNTRVGNALALSTKVFVTDLDRPRVAVDLGSSAIAALPRVEPETPFVNGVSGLMVGRLRHYRTVGVEHRMEAPAVTLFGRPHTMQWGVRTERHELDDQRSRGGPGQVLSATTRGDIVRDTNYRAAAASAYVQDATRFGPVTMTAGVRLEHYTQHRRRLPSVDEGPEGGPRESDANTLVLPSVSAVYDAGADTAVFATIGRGYTPAFARTAAGFPLQPETGLNLQAGVRSARVRGLTVEAATFHNRLSQTVVQLPFTIGDQNLFINSEHARVSGVEGGLHLNSAAWTESRVNAFTRANVTMTRAVFSSGDLVGRRVPEVPRHAGSITAGVEHVWGWHVSTTYAVVGSFMTDLANTRTLTLADEDGQPLSPTDSFQLRETVVLGEVPGHGVISARVNVHVPDTPMTLWLQGRNLTNRLYIVDLANGLRPGGPRTVSAGVRVQF